MRFAGATVQHRSCCCCLAVRAVHFLLLAVLLFPVLHGVVSLLCVRGSKAQWHARSSCEGDRCFVLQLQLTQLLQRGMRTGLEHLLLFLLLLLRSSLSSMGECV